MTKLYKDPKTHILVNRPLLASPWAVFTRYLKVDISTPLIRQKFKARQAIASQASLPFIQTSRRLQNPPFNTTRTTTH